MTTNVSTSPAVTPAPTLSAAFGSATVAEIREQLAGLAGNTDMALLRRVFTHARTTGWTSPWMDTWWSPDQLVCVDLDRATRQVRVLRRESDAEPWPWGSDWHHVTSVREAVDLLVLLGVLPVEMSSMYAAGRADRAVQVAA